MMNDLYRHIMMGIFGALGGYYGSCSSLGVLSMVILFIYFFLHVVYHEMFV